MTTTTDSQDTNTDQENTELSHEEATKTEQEKAEEAKAKEAKEATPQELKQREIIAANQKKIDEGLVEHKDLAPWIQEQTTAKVKVQDDSEKEALRKSIKEDIEYENLVKSLPKDITEEQAKQMEDMMGDEKLKTLSKPERLEYVMYKVGVDGTKEQKARQEGLEIGRFGLLGLGNHDPKTKEKSEEEKITQKYMDNLPDFAKK